MIKNFEVFLVSIPGEPDKLFMEPYDVMNHANLGTMNKTEFLKHLDWGHGTYVTEYGILIVRWDLRYIDERGGK